MSDMMRNRAALTGLFLARYIERGYTIRARCRDAMVTLAVSRPGDPPTYYDGGTLDACVAQLPEPLPVPRPPRIARPPKPARERKPTLTLDVEKAAEITADKRRYWEGAA